MTTPHPRRPRPRIPSPCLEWAQPACSFKAASGPRRVFSPLRRRQGTGFTFKAAQGLLGRPAGWRRWDLLTAAGPGEAGREPEPEREAGPSGRRRSTRADRAGRGGALGRPRGGVVLGAACERARPARGEGAQSWVAGGGISAFSGEGSAGCRAGLWGAAWGEGGDEEPEISAP